MEQQGSPTLDRLEDQIAWYDRKSRTAERRYKLLKLTQIVAAALIPLVSVFPIHEPQSVTAVLGLLVVIVEAVQQLNQDQQNWISYRSTCESLKHEKYLFLAGAGSYLGPANRIALLAERIEGLISQEHATWVSVQERATKDHYSESLEKPGVQDAVPLQSYRQPAVNPIQPRDRKID